MACPTDPKLSVPTPGDRVRASETVLVALDGSAFGESALPHAQSLARALGNPLHLVTALDPTVTGGTAETSAECRLQRIETERYLDQLVRILEAEGLEVSFEVREGDPADEVVAAGLERGAGTVVVASRPRRDAGRLVSRGVANGVMASGTMSLLVARGTETIRRRRGHGSIYRRIAVGVDGSETSHRALGVAASLARSQDACIVLVHVLPADFGATRPSSPRSGPDGGPRRDFDAPGEAGRYLEELERDLGRDVASVRTVLCRSAGVADAVAETAREEGADLLVLGARGAGEAGARYGRCAHRLLLRAELPVLVVRTERPRSGEVGPGRRAARRPRTRRSSTRRSGEPLAPKGS